MSDQGLSIKRFIVAGIIVVFSCMAAFRAFAQELPSQARANRTSWVRSDSYVTATLEVARFWNGPEKENLHEISNLHPFVISWTLRDAKALTGLDPAEVARLVVSEEWPAGWVVAVETTEGVHTDRLLTNLIPDAAATTLHRRSFYANDKYALCSLESHTTLIATPPDTIRAVLARLEMRPATAASVPAIAIGEPALLDVTIRPDGFRNAFGKEGAPSWLMALLNANYFRLSFEPAQELTFRLSGQFPDDAMAEASVESVRLAIAQLEKYLEMCEKNMPVAVERFASEYPGAEKLGPMLDQAIKAARLGLRNAKVQRDSNTVSAVASIQTAHPATDTVLLLSLMPRAKK